MKKFILIAVVTASLFSCCNTKKVANTDATQAQPKIETPVAVQYTVVENFFLKNTVTLADSINVLTAKDADGFNKLFGAARTMNNQTIVPDFANASVVAIACKASKIQKTIEVGSVTTDVNGLNVHVGIKTGLEQSFSSQPVTILNLPKQPNGQKVHVFLGDKEVASATI